MPCRFGVCDGPAGHDGTLLMIVDFCRFGSHTDGCQLAMPALKLGAGVAWSGMGWRGRFGSPAC